MSAAASITTWDRFGRMFSEPATAEQARKAAFLSACLVFFALFVIGGHAMLSDSDALWHIRSGQEILRTGHFPTVDAWSWRAEGQPWIAKEWLSQVLYALAFNLAGWNGVVALAAFAVALAFGLLAWFAMGRLPRWLAYGCVAAAFVMASSHFLTRPHVLSYPLIVIWFAGLARACDERRAPSFALLPVMLLWANMHGGFTLGLAYAGGFAVCTVWEAQGDRRELIIRWGMFLVLAGLAALVTPYGIQSVLITAKLLGFGQQLAIIVEWKPPNLARDKGSMVVVLAWVALALWSARRHSPPRILLILGVLYLFFSANRNGELLGFLLPFFIVSGRAPRRDWLALGAGEWKLIGGVSAVAVLAALGISLVARSGLKPVVEHLPVGCVAYARDHGLVGKRVLNAYEFGGYLISEKIPTYIDGRAELFGPEAIEEYDELQLLLGDHPLVPLDRDGIAWTLFNPGTPVTKLLDYLPGWTRVYAEERCVVHVRNAAL